MTHRGRLVQAKQCVALDGGRFVNAFREVVPESVCQSGFAKNQVGNPASAGKPGECFDCAVAARFKQSVITDQTNAFEVLPVIKTEIIDSPVGRVQQSVTVDIA